MFGDNRLIHAACDYAEMSERFRSKYRRKSKDYLQGRIDQYDHSDGIHNFPLIGQLFEPQEVRIIRSVLEEKIEEETSE